MAETKFKKVDFEDLSASTKSTIEANAASQGVTPEQYYESRGGVNRSGYFGDAYQTAEQGGRPYLSDEQYSAALEGLTGVAHYGKQEFDGANNEYASYEDYKLGLQNAFDNGVNIGAFWTDTKSASDAAWVYNGRNIGKQTGTVFVQKTF